MLRVAKKILLVIGMISTGIGILAMLALFAYAGASGDFHPLGMDSPGLVVLAVAWFGLILLMIGNEWDA